MNYKHPNLFVMIPYEERNRVSGYFDLSVVGEEYAKLLGDLTDELSILFLRSLGVQRQILRILNVMPVLPT